MLRSISPKFAEIRRNSYEIRRNSPKWDCSCSWVSPKSAEIGRNWPNRSGSPAARRNSPEIRPKFGRTEKTIRPKFARNSYEFRPIREASPTFAEIRRNPPEIRRNSPNPARRGKGPASISPKFAEIRRNSPKSAEARKRFAEFRTKFVRNSTKLLSGVSLNVQIRRNSAKSPGITHAVILCVLLILFRRISYEIRTNFARVPRATRPTLDRRSTGLQLKFNRNWTEVGSDSDGILNISINLLRIPMGSLLVFCFSRATLVHGKYKAYVPLVKLVLL